ncbi:MAG: hypothetical protein HYU77_17250 [Betaproteobacteria bacterium]|nr:hypothetical protein [Betaproteobacteria bacterium]
MTVLLITIDPDKSPAKGGKDFGEYLERFKHVRLAENAFAVRTKEHPRVISWELGKLLGKDATYYVISLNAPYDGFGPADVNDWLKKHLKK